jgi:hypothetical protein
MASVALLAARRAAAVLCVVAAAVPVVAAPAAAPAAVTRSAPAAGDLLPDLDQEVPSQLDVSVQLTGHRREYRLGFGSGVRNVGAGPLIIDGRRPAGSRDMLGRQLIQTADGTQRTVPGIGNLRYVRSPDHQHWHFLRFDRYELRRAGGTRALVRDRKSGFCLGDRYRVTTRPVAGAAASPTYTSRCGLRRPGMLHVREGISVGYGDFYAAHLEYQDLPIDGLRDGRYVLVHRANVDRRLQESNYDNNAASVLLNLRWVDGVPHLAVLRDCPDSARCDRPDAAVSAVAAAARVPEARAQVRAAPARRMLCALQGTAGLPAWEPRANSVVP